MEFTITKPEDDPYLFKLLLDECERINNANPELLKIHETTWVKKEKE